MGYFDSMMLSHVEAAAVSGVSLADTVVSFLIAVLAALPVAGTILIAQSLGGGDTSAAKRNAWTLFFYSLLFSLISCCIVLIAGRSLIYALFPGASSEIKEVTLIYLRICTLSLPFLSLLNACAAICRAAANTRVPMLVACVVSVLDIALSALFLFHFRMDAAGVALGTLLSRLLGCVWFLFYTRGWQKGAVRFLIHNKAVEQRLLRMATPHMLENAFFYAGRIIIASMAASLGTDANVAYAIAVPVDSIAFLMIASIDTATFTIVGTLMGAGCMDGARQSTKRLLFLSYASTFVLVTALLLFLPAILQTYEGTIQAKALAHTIIIIYAVGASIFGPPAFTLASALRAIERTKLVFAVNSSALLLCRVFLGVVLGISCGLGMIGVWIATVAEWLYRCIAYSVCARKAFAPARLPI